MERNLALQKLDTAVGQFVAVCAQSTTSFQYFNELSGHFSLLVGAIYVAEASCSREDILSLVAPARAIMAKSGFLHRLQSWPRGYQGDFETIEHLIAQRNTSEPGTAHYWMEQQVLGSTMSQQHRNKISMQAMEVLQQAVLASQDGKKRRILIIACGGSSDLHSIKGLLANTPIEIVMNDIDEGALAYSVNRLEDLSEKIRIEHGNILLKLRELAKQPPFDLILTGGLYDYLSDSQAAKLTRFSCAHLLTEEGAFVFTNLSTDNPVRPWLEYLVDWHMNYRTEEMIDDMLQRHGVGAAQVLHARDATGHAIVTRVCRHSAHTSTAPRLDARPTSNAARSGQETTGADTGGVFASLSH